MSKARTLPPEEQVPVAEIADWRQHPRLQRHLRKFEKHPSQARLLSLYRRRAVGLPAKQLMRYACHVGCWVALLPADIAAQRSSDCDAAGGDALSPVELLAELLHLRGCGKISGWLRGILHLIALGLKDARSSAATPQASEAWHKLHKSIPRTVWRDLQQSRCPALPKDSEESNGETWLVSQAGLITLKTIRRQQRAALVCGHLSNEPGHYANLALFHSRALAALKAADADALANLVVHGLALLSPPRVQAVDGSKDVCMPDEAQQRLRCRQQSRIRATLVQILDVLDLEDAGTRKLLLVPLKRLAFLLQDQDLRCVSSKAQWIELLRALQLAGLDIRTDAIDGPVPPRAVKRKHDTFSTEQKTPRGLMHKLVTQALTDLGEATAKEIIQHIKHLETWSEVSKHLNQLPTKQARQPKGLTSWETSLATYLSKTKSQDVIQPTGQKRGKEIIWRLSPKTPSIQ
eukprot:TRINITY_DN57158_c0_g1_i1.p1 TRINITY_DN57158_c0_g1~~TRINITY_DN57158_c0_g1_i1.p1  ORF type:complete len:462 (+),score=65.65 TRINITY_DN57158_c0_g1_i1:34-1419(+)